MPKYIHISISVRGVLKKPFREFAKEFKGVLTETNTETREARALTPEEAREWFLDQLAQGREVVPCGDCDNFDYKNGCQGHDE